MKILVRDGKDKLLKVSGHKALWLLDTFQTAADDPSREARDVTTLIVQKGFFSREEKYIPLALDFMEACLRPAKGWPGHKIKDLTDVSGRAVNARIKQQLNIT